MVTRFYWFSFLLVLAACTPAVRSGRPPILLFAGSGTSANDVKAVRAVLEERHLEYSAIDSTQMNHLSRDELLAYKLLIIPGGNFIDMGKGLTLDTTTNIHRAVEGGMNYLGVCAGGFLAGQGGTSYNSLNLSSGVRFGFYSAAKAGTRKAVVPIRDADNQVLEHYWEDGPEFTGWGDVVARYPDGTPAIVEGRSGKGWVVLAGIHAEAPAEWRNGMSFTTPVGVDKDYAGKLVEAALRGASLPHF